MPFKSIIKSDQHFRIVRQHIINQEGFTPKFTLIDHTTATPYYFQCPVCKSSSTNVDHLNAGTFNSDHIKIDKEAFMQYGGTGLLSKLIQCENCTTHYFIGIGYTEPNNGRDVFLLNNILELVEI